MLYPNLNVINHHLFLLYVAKQEMVGKLGIHFVSFDRPGYGESDPDPKRTMKSLALDIEELGHQLQLGTKFYIIGNSMGGLAVWGCLKYIPHRLVLWTTIHILAVFLQLLLIFEINNYYYSKFYSPSIILFISKLSNGFFSFKNMHIY